MNDHHSQASGGNGSLWDHAEEGVEILSRMPSALASGMIYVGALLLLSALIWSFFGKSDVIVSVPGRLLPASGRNLDPALERVYSMVDGSLVDILSEDTLVAKGDILARIDAHEAVLAADNAAREVRRLLYEAEDQKKSLPRRRRAMEAELDSLNTQRRKKEEAYNRLVEGVASEAQKEKLNGAMAEVRSCERRVADGEDRVKRFEEEERQGGQVKKELRDAREILDAAKKALSDAKTAQAEFLEEVGSSAIMKAKEELDAARIAYAEKEEAIEQSRETEVRVDARLQEARTDIVREPKYEVDKEGNLLVRAPAAGVVAEVFLKQRGEKVSANTPLALIVPRDARKVLIVDIPVRDSTLLRSDRQVPVKIKLDAFPYQRYGTVSGTLVYISPTPRSSTTTEPPVFEGRVRLESDVLPGGKDGQRLRYGDTATADIVVEKRRLIDLALGTFRELGK